jgi:sulfite exporter TauE/SafE
MTFIMAGLALGVAASVHCVVMCGPLMIAMLPRRNSRAAMLYHSGRLSTYALLGAVTGAIGQLAMLAGAGRLLSVVAGLALIWTAARRAGWMKMMLTARGFIPAHRHAEPQPQHHHHHALRPAAHLENGACGHS